MSRRLCTSRHHRGPRWRHAIDFHVRQWADAEKTRPKTLQSQCKCCQRMQVRITQGIKRRGKPFGQRKTGMTREEYRKHRQRKHQQLMADPVLAQQRREEQRMNATLRRRRAGIPPRNFKRPQERDYVDAAPFLRWLDELLQRRRLTLAEACRMAEVDEQRIRDARERGTIDLTYVDRFCTWADEMHMVVLLYPVDGTV